MILTPHMTQMAHILGHNHNCIRLPPYAYEQHMNVLKNSIYVQYGYGKQFVVAVSHHHDIMIWFLLRAFNVLS
jgi:hypothetical protein